MKKRRSTGKKRASPFHGKRPRKPVKFKSVAGKDQKPEKKGLNPGRTAQEDIKAVMDACNLPEAFPEKVLAEADEIEKYLKHPGKRLDLRRKFIFTCDPESARDYDDALSLDKDKAGNLVLGVHIADVSHFVRPASALDKEAYKRATSVYLAERVIPMLPEKLSDGVCSLVPNEDRLAFSVFMTFNAAGRMVERKFAKSIIRSKARFSYEQVLDMINGKASAKREYAKVAWQGTVRKISALAQKLRSARFAAGAMDLAVPEVEVVLDGNHEMVDLKIRANDVAHQMVEECMVAANEAVATEMSLRKIKYLSRFHDAPDPEKLHELQVALKHLGIKTGNLEDHAQFRKLSRIIRGKPLEGVAAVMILRSMRKALYDARHTGHWGLAKRYYAHFTSPIRRYPDLTLHRELSFLLGAEGGLKCGAKMDMDKLAVHTTEREVQAAEAERNLIEVKKYRFLEKNPGPHDAVVCKTGRFGVFVDIPAIAASGLVHISKLAKGYVRYNETTEELSCGDMVWKIGTTMRVKVLSIDFERRRVDFERV